MNLDIVSFFVGVFMTIMVSALSWTFWTIRPRKEIKTEMLTATLMERTLFNPDDVARALIEAWNGNACGIRDILK